MFGSSAFGGPSGRDGLTLILERIGDSYECLRCLFSVSLMPDAVKHAKEEHQIQYIHVDPYTGVYEIDAPMENPL